MVPASRGVLDGMERDATMSGLKVNLEVANAFTSTLTELQRCLAGGGSGGCGGGVKGGSSRANSISLSGGGGRRERRRICLQLREREKNSPSCKVSVRADG